MVSCCICSAPAEALVLCARCARAAVQVPDLVPEQIRMTAQGECQAALIDAWGRLYRLARRTEIGREPVGAGIAIHQGSVSRKHAVIEVEEGGTVCLRDLHSTNGTVVARRSVRDSIELVSGDLLFFGSVGFYFVSPVPPLRDVKLTVGTLSVGDRKPEDSRQHDGFRPEHTDVSKAPKLELRTVEATGGGGGFAYVAGQEIQISMVQLELLELLMERMVSDRDRPVAVRGYVHSSEILAAVSWDTAHPGDNHVKQLVRRLRRSLARSGRDDLIESQQGLGYRLSVVPV